MITEDFTLIPPEQRIARARSWLLRNKPMWGALLMRLKIAPSRTKTDGMITDAVRILYHPDFVATLDLEGCCFSLAHEVAHCALRHVFRIGDRDHEAFEEAADHVVNLMLVRDGFKVPDHIEVLMDPQFEGMSVEQVYPIILAQKQQEQQAQAQAQQQQQKGAQGSKSGDSEPQSGSASADDEGDSDSEQQESSAAQGQQKKEKRPGEMAAPGSLKDPGESDGAGDQPADDAAEEESEREAQEAQGSGDDGDSDSSGEQQQGSGDEQGGEMSEADAQSLSDEWGQAAATAAMQASKRGQGSMQSRRGLLESNKAPRSFEEYLRYFIAQRCTRSDQSWRRQSRASISSGIYLPGRRGQRLGALVAVIDTSGSIDDRALHKFVINLQKAQADLRPDLLIAIYADDMVCKEVRFDRHDEFSVEAEMPVGGGGTDFKPAFMRMCEIRDNESIDIAGVVYLTDLDGPMHSAAEAAELDLPPTLWCFDSHDVSVWRRESLVERVTFGEVAVLEA